MATNKEIVSRIKNQLRFLTKDEDINDRFILFTAQNIATTFISQKMREMTLHRESNLFIEIPCVDMEKVDPLYCGIFEFKRCGNLVRSKKQIPGLIYTKHGSSLKEVTSIDNEFLFKESTVAQYRRDSRRSGFKPGTKFYIKDNYLFIPDSNIRKVNLYVLALDQYDLNEICECDQNCMSAWDYEFICPSKLLEPVIENTVNQLTITKQIPEEENPNLSQLS